MPEYLAPGVFVEEVSFRSKSIEGVSTTTTGFVGPTRYGPVDIEPDIITSLVEFEHVYGDRQKLRFATGSDVSEQDNFIWHAARAFFEEGGKRLYVGRIFKPLKADGAAEEPIYARPSAALQDESATKKNELYIDGHARAWVPQEPLASADKDEYLLTRARFPGFAGNVRVRLTVRFGQNILSGQVDKLRASGLREYDMVWIGDVTSPISSPPGSGDFFIARYDTNEKEWHFCRDKEMTDADLRLNSTDPYKRLDPGMGHQLRKVTLSIALSPASGGTPFFVRSDMAVDPRHVNTFGAPDSLATLFSQNPNSLLEARTLPIVIIAGSKIDTGLKVLQKMKSCDVSFSNNVMDAEKSDADHSIELLLKGGNDGQQPTSAEYSGNEDPKTNFKFGLKAFEDLEDLSIVAAPGATFGYKNNENNAKATMSALITHASNMRYRVAVLDGGDGQSISEVRALRAGFDSSHAALYYPWIRVLDPVTNSEINLPPSGFVAGIYARNDRFRAVYKAPANEVVNLALGFETMLNKSQQEVLNPEGINCFRFFEGRGNRLWGARTISSDPEWKYVNVRRYFAYIERSIDKGTQWAVFEPNGEALWANVRRTIEDFLFNEWVSGALLGEKPEKAYFVKCDRSTMTQNDLDNGRLICQIGVAALKPAEFVVFRIGQWTADRRS